MDPSNNPGAPADAAPAGTPAPGADAQAQAAPADGADARRWQDTFKRINDLEKLVKGVLPVAAPKSEQKPETQAAPADAAMQRVAELERRLALKDAFEDLGIKAGPAREVLEMAVKAANPEDVRGFIERYAGSFGAPAAPASAPAQAAPRTNTGAPAADPRTALPSDPRLMPKGVWQGLDPAERKKLFEQHLSNQGLNSNIWARGKKK